MSPAELSQVSDAQLDQYARLIYERTGIRVSPQKKTLLSNRVRRRLRETGIDGFDGYLKHLKKLPPKDPEWDAFLQEITTHETFLFRDEGQWAWFRQEYLPECLDAAQKDKRKKQLRFWSAACSTGDEAYTMACCVSACLLPHPGWNVRILGTDIGIGAVEQASDPVFSERAMRLVPKDYYRFFNKAKDASLWQPKPNLQKLVSFRHHNLLDPIRELPFDLVVLKNVLIYFDAESKKRVLANVCSALRPGGLLISGAAEGVASMLQGFQRLQPWLHRRLPE
ncbi:MAG: protein-glutamate O-methyltransferase CheR [Pirellulales bacterium]|nr:protein-glutamate O-methyltransferase CheR [Pirellulales bacterium]